MIDRIRSSLAVVALVALASCGSEAVPLADPASPAGSLPAVEPPPAAETTTAAPDTTNVAEPTSTLAEPPNSTPLGESVRIELDRYQIDGVLPPDADRDPVGEPTPPDFVLESRRWMTDCCWLMLTVQNERPLHPSDQLVETARVDGLEWALYDSADEGFLQIAVTTVDDISISIATQQRFEGDEATPEASEMVRSMVDTLRVRER